jgi:hypothetical protein
MDTRDIIARLAGAELSSAEIIPVLLGLAALALGALVGWLWRGAALRRMRAELDRAADAAQQQALAEAGLRSERDRLLAQLEDIAQRQECPAG